MKIRTRIKIIITVLVIFIALLISTDVLSSRQLRANVAQLERVADINIKIFQLNVLTSDYLLHFSDRSMEQWWSVHKELGVSLQALTLHGEEENEVIESTLDRYRELAEIFNTLVDSHEKEQFASRAMRDLHSKLRERETTRLLLLAQVIQRDIFKLRHMSNEKILKTQQYTTTLKFTVEIMFLIFIIANAFFLMNNLVGPIEEIHRGTQIIGKGDFDHQIPPRGRENEISRLITAFNTMTQNLKSVTASRDELDKIRAELAAQAQKLQNSNNELEQFAYIASHDLQEPLSNVLNYSNLLEKRYAGQLDDKARTYIDQINHSAMHMRSLIHDLLTFSRIEHRDLEKNNVDCNDILHKVLSGMLNKVEAIGGRITWDRLPTVRAHENSLIQLFQNLIGNAIKFRRDVPIRIHIGAYKREEEWIFWVQDNGVGIEHHYYEKIFAMFQRLHDQTEYSGTGIGLAICKKIVEKHGGRIWVESEVGQGSTFYFSVPAEPSPAYS